MIESELKEFIEKLLVILKEIQTTPQTQAPPLVVTNELKKDLTPFFASVRKTLFGGKLTAKQVEGMEAKIDTFLREGFSLSHAAYALATSYHETARKMQPVKEGLTLSDAWRKRNLRYYPWFGRGDVQLTWEENYKKADEKLNLGGRLVNNLDLALDPVVSSQIMARGMKEGWFSGDKQGKRHTLARHLPNPVGTRAQFKQARRIINIMDKADLIAGQAVLFQDALKAANYSTEGV